MADSLNPDYAFGFAFFFNVNLPDASDHASTASPLSISCWSVAYLSRLNSLFIPIEMSSVGPSPASTKYSPLVARPSVRSEPNRS
jgi:hypothetical protein